MKDLHLFTFESEHIKNPHGIFEMAQISDKVDQLPENTSVWVYGENDEQGTKPPHFHVMLDNKRFEFEIKFDDVNTLDIWRSKSVKHDWQGYKNVKKALKEWLLKPNSENPKLTNWEMILTVWNLDNKKKVNKDVYMKLLTCR